MISITRARAQIIQTYYVPISEEDNQAFLGGLRPGEVDGTNISVISISIFASNTVVYYDHWEDGFEDSLSSPTSGTSEVWGNGASSDGCAPGVSPCTDAADILSQGDVISTQDEIPANPRNASNVFFDGRDKFGSDRPLAVTRAAWDTQNATLFAGAVEVAELDNFGIRYDFPVGTNVVVNSGGPGSPENTFDTVGVGIMAATNNTTVVLDRDGNGTPDVTTNLNEGETLFLADGIQAGGSVTSTAPIQVHLLTGDPAATYETRWFTLSPTEEWSADYYNPVGTVEPDDEVGVFLFNPGSGSITVLTEFVSGGFVVVETNTVPAGGVTTKVIATLDTAQHYFSTGDEPFFAIGVVDVNNSGSTHDWGFSLVPEQNLTPTFIAGWAPGRDPTSSVSPNTNVSPVWITAVADTTLYLDYNGNGGTQTNECGTFDGSVSAAFLESVRVFDPDGDQTGLRVFTCDGTDITAAWGQDPSVAPAAEPSLDLGTTILPLPTIDAQKSVALAPGGDVGGDGNINPGDTIRYSVTITNDTPSDSGNILVIDSLPGGVVYLTGTTFRIDGATTNLLLDGGATPFPLDESGTNIGVLSSFSATLVQFDVLIDSPWTNEAATITNQVTVRDDVSTVNITDSADLMLQIFDVGVIKSVFPINPVEGQAVTYTLIATNAGTDPVTGMEVTDSLPTGVTLVSSSSGDYVAPTWTVGALAAGGSTSLVIAATVDTNTVGTSITNIATVTDLDQVDGNPNNNTDDAVINVISQSEACAICYLVADAGGGNGGDDWLTLFDKATGAETNIGAGTGTFTIEAIAYSPWSNILYAADADELGVVDTTTGVYSTIGSFGSGDGSVGTIAFSDVDGLTFDPFTEILYGTHRRTSADDILFQIDPTTGSAIPDAFGVGVDYVVVNAISGLGDIDDIAIDSHDGQMYGIANNGGTGDRLVQIDKSSGTATDVGLLGVDDGEGLGFDNFARLFGTVGAAGGTNSNSAIEINQATGAATNITALTVGSDYEAADCLICPPNVILGTVFFDLDEDGLLDPADIGTSNITVRLYRDVDGDGMLGTNDVLVAAKVSDGSGDYRFDVAASGAFVVDIDTNDLPASAVLTTDNLEEADFGTGTGLTDSGNDFGYTAPSPLLVTKSSDVTGLVTNGQIITYTVTVANTGTVTQTGISVADPVPTGTSFEAGSTQVTAPTGTTETIRDQFDAVAYTNNDGSIDWLGNWDETGDDDLPNGGDVVVENDISNYQLRIQDQDNSIGREANLSSYDSAVLSFVYRRNGIEAGEYFAIEAATNGLSGPWTELDRFEGAGGFPGLTDGSYISTNYDLISFINTNTAIRFVSPAGGMSNGDQIYIDNVQISVSFRTTNTFAGGDAPTLVSGKDLEPGETIIITFEVQADAPATVPEIVNTACASSDQNVGPSCAVVTDRVWQVDLGVVKDVTEVDNDGDVGTNEVITYTIIVTNFGPDAATGVELTDTFPANVTYLSSAATKGSYNDITGLWDGFTLASNESATLFITGQVAAAFGASITNTIIVTDVDQFDTNLNNHTDRVVVVATLALVSSVRAEAVGNDVYVVWETASEVGTAGYFVEARRGDGWNRLNTRIVPAFFDTAPGGIYRVADPEARAGDTRVYRLVEIEVGGGQLVHGPYEVEVAALKHPAKAGALPSPRLARDASGASKARHAANRLMKGRQESAGKILTPASAVLITTPEDGIYRINASDVAALLGQPEETIVDLVASGGMALTLRGEGVPYVSVDDGEALLFYGRKNTVVQEGEHIYVLAQGTGLPMDSLDGGGPGSPPSPQVYPFTAVFEEQVMDFTRLADDPEDDYWFWDYLSGGDPANGVRSYEVSLPGLASSGAAELSVHLSGLTTLGLPGEHQVLVRVNGEEVGSVSWSGAVPETLFASIPVAQLADATNTIELEAKLADGVAFSLVLLDSMEVRYPRRYIANGGSYRFAAAGHDVLTVDRFANSTVRVFDVSDPASPRVVNNLYVGGGDGEYLIGFETHNPQAEYVAVAAGEEQAAALSPAPEDELAAPDLAAAYLVITAPELRNAADALAAYRADQGLTTKVVTTPEVYASFNDHISGPLAIRAFLDYAYHNWAHAPYYVVLAGSGSYDYKDYAGAGDNLVPVLMTPTEQGLFAADNLLADVEGQDALPEMLIGRLPVLNEAELLAVLNKLMAYESSDDTTWAGTATVVADNPDQGGDFTLTGDELAAIATGDVNKIYLEELSTADARAQLTASLEGGAATVTYAGHGAMDKLAGEGLLTVDDVTGLENEENAPVVTALSCLIGRYERPGVDALSETLVSATNGGAVAVWAPSGMSLNLLAQVLGEGFFQAQYQEDQAFVGDAVGFAIDLYGQLTTDAQALSTYNFIGDPAMYFAGRADDPTLAFQRWLRNWFNRDALKDPAVNNLAADPDGDGVGNVDEFGRGLDPSKSDTDGDGYDDGLEIQRGSDPGDFTSIPAPRTLNDFDGDGSSDVTVYYGTAGTWFIRQSGDQSLRALNWGWSETVPVPADYDGDAVTDVAVYHPGSGNWYILESGSGLLRIQHWGWVAAEPVPGDYDGDGRSDIAVYHGARGDWYILQSATSELRALNWGWSATRPVPRDYDGDRQTDVAVYHPDSGTWYILESSTGALRTERWGWSETVPRPNDYDGDHVADVAVYHAASGGWFIHESSTGDLRFDAWGWFAVRAAPADYDGDGLVDVAVYYPASGDWFIQESGTGQLRSLNWGWSATLPVPTFE